MYTGSEGLSLQANFAILGLLRLEMLSFVTRFNISDKREFSRFYHPRWDHWGTHFKLNNCVIEAVTNIGEITARILGLNDQTRLLERQLLIDRGKYPSSSAIKRMNP
jgi:hypothetical protein